MAPKTKATPAGSVVIVGNMDGVHLGHQALIARARALAGDAMPVRALTFDPHPLAVLRPQLAPQPITTLMQRISRLERYGVDEVVVQKFDQEYAELSADAFVEQVLVRTLHAHTVIVGENFRFGKDRQGTIETLSALAKTHGLKIEIVEPVEHNHARVSSTRVRQALSDGDVGLAAELLNHYHVIEGIVVKGDGRGTQIGVPTANLTDIETIAARPGVYASAVHMGAHDLFAGALNIGVRPTFAAGFSIEVHLLDYSGNLQGQRIQLALIERLRDEQTFASVSALTEQIKIDIARCAQVAQRRVPRWLADF